jgi:hypothetical protein
MNTLQKFILLSTIFLSISQIINAQDSTAIVPKIEAILSFGYVEDNLKWSIAGNLDGQNPNIYSELIWKNTRGPLGELKLKFFRKNLVLNANISFSAIDGGSVTDSDYSQENRTGRTFFAKARSNQGKRNGLKLSVGNVIYLSRRITITPSFGYGKSSQELFLLNDQRLSSRYRTYWKGPFAFLEAELPINTRVNTQIGITYHQNRYDAEADWNLISAFKHPLSFSHHAKGYGVESNFSFTYLMTRFLFSHISAQHFRWSTGRGADELYYNDGRITKTRLNGVIRSGFAVMTGIKVQY